METATPTELSELRSALSTLSERVVALEALIPALAEPVSGNVNVNSSSETQADSGSPFWALDALRAKLHDHPSTEQGVVMLVGSLTLPTGAPVAWQQAAGTAGIFDTDWGERATAFAALGHPVRLELVRQILSGVHATADLASIDTLGTTGQLHHHLRQLVAAGWVRQSGRGSYEVPAARIVPLLASLVGASS